MLNILILEDQDTDAELVVHTLKRSGLDFSYIIVKTKTEYLFAIDSELRIDAILADNTLPQFSALEALELYLDRKMEIPFLLVTGSISEEYAVDIIKKGASDYILKDRLKRLPNALINSIQKFKIEADRKKFLVQIVKHEELLKEAARIGKFGSWQMELKLGIDEWSDEMFHILGCSPGSVIPSTERFVQLVHPEDRSFVRKKLDFFSSLAGLPEREKFECRILDENGAPKYLYAEFEFVLDEKGVAERANGIVKDISETKIAELNAIKITDDLVQRNKDLEQFTYIVSHNLRAPVANIKGVLELLIAGILNETEKNDFLESLALSVWKLDDIIVDLNKILQVRQNTYENKENVLFEQLIDEVLTGLTSILPKEHLVIVTDFSGFPGMHTVRSYLYSIFYNLISNSIKFRQQGNLVRLELMSYGDNGQVFFTFEDNGIGIDLVKRKGQIFGLYKRFHPDHAEGKGMGLYMVKTQVESLGGKITVDSEVNKGTKFTISFSSEHAIMQ